MMPTRQRFIITLIISALPTTVLGAARRIGRTQPAEVGQAVTSHRRKPKIYAPSIPCVGRQINPVCAGFQECFRLTGGGAACLREQEKSQ